MNIQKLRERRGQQFSLFAIIEGILVFLLIKMGNEKKDGHRGGVRECPFVELQLWFSKVEIFKIAKKYNENKI